MPAKIYKLKPDHVQAYKLTNDPAGLLECARWCGGSLTVKYHEGKVVDYGTSIAFLRGGTNDTDKEADEAHIGDYIIKYRNIEKHGEGFFSVPGMDFEAVYEAE